VGRLIPAGTGMEFYRAIKIKGDPGLYPGQAEAESVQAAEIAEE
jgi:hypothetical protein